MPDQRNTPDSEPGENECVPGHVSSQPHRVAGMLCVPRPPPSAARRLRPGARRLTRSPGGQIGSWSPVQSPDGTRIVFVSDRFGDARDFRENIDLFIMNADGSNEHRVTSNPWMEAHPDW